MIEILRDPAWQGIGAIVGILSIVVSIWLARSPSIRGKLARNSWHGVAAILSLLLPVYSVFALSIITVNAVTQDARTVLYYSVALASLLGVIWGIVWGIYIQKAFFANNKRRTSRKPPIQGA